MTSLIVRPTSPYFDAHYFDLGADLPLKAAHPNFTNFEYLLSPGWIPGRKVDNSDQQYAGFRNNIPYLLILLVVHPSLRRGYESLCTGSASTNGHLVGQPDHKRVSERQILEADVRLERRITFDIYFAAIYLLALHGLSALKILLILAINYKLATSLSKSYVPIATWTFNIGILFANEIFQGFPYAEIARFFEPWAGMMTKSTVEDTTINWGSLLDSYGGLIPRWEVLFNITILRLISFNLDYYWQSNQSNNSALEVCSASIC